jgi:hypothetical protein
VGCFDPAMVTKISHLPPKKAPEWNLNILTNSPILDYTLNNPDTLTKYRSAAAISEKVLAAVSALCVAGEKIVAICEKGDKLLDEEIAKVYRGKKVTKGRRISSPLLDL